MATDNSTNTHPDTARLVAEANALLANPNRAEAGRDNAMRRITIDVWRESLSRGREVAS